MAGDSNTRETMNALERQFVRRNFSVALAWPPKHLTQITRLRPFKDAAGRDQIGCQTKFFDQERLLVHNGSRACVWLSLRFLLHQGEAVRLLPSTWPPRQRFDRPMCDDAQWQPSRDPRHFWRCAEHVGWAENDTTSEVRVRVRARVRPTLSLTLP